MILLALLPRFIPPFILRIGINNTIASIVHIKRIEICVSVDKENIRLWAVNCPTSRDAIAQTGRLKSIRKSTIWVATISDMEKDSSNSPPSTCDKIIVIIAPAYGFQLRNQGCSLIAIVVVVNGIIL